jgi:hypothetical protein
MKVNTDTLMYRRQMVNMANEAKKQLLILVLLIMKMKNIEPIHYKK